MRVLAPAPLFTFAWRGVAWRGVHYDYFRTSFWCPNERKLRNKLCTCWSCLRFGSGFRALRQNGDVSGIVSLSNVRGGPVNLRVDDDVDDAEEYADDAMDDDDEPTVCARLLPPSFADRRRREDSGAVFILLLLRLLLLPADFLLGLLLCPRPLFLVVENEVADDDVVEPGVRSVLKVSLSSMSSARNSSVLL